MGENAAHVQLRRRVEPHRRGFGKRSHRVEFSFEIEVRRGSILEITPSSIDILFMVHELLCRLSSARRLGEALKYWLADVEQKRSLTFLYLEQITDVASREKIWAAADACHLRNSEPKK